MFKANTIISGKCCIISESYLNEILIAHPYAYDVDLFAMAKGLSLNFAWAC